MKLTAMKGSVRTVAAGSVQVLDIVGHFVHLAVFSNGTVEENVRERILPGGPQPSSQYTSAENYPNNWPHHPESAEPACGWTWRALGDWVNIDGVQLKVVSLNKSTVEFERCEVAIVQLLATAKALPDAV